MTSSIQVVAAAQSDGYMFRLFWGLVVTPIGLILACDYRNASIRLFDFIESHTPGGAGSASHNLLRVFGAILGLVGLSTSIFAAYKIIFG
ncbi:hypothetical protein [Streptomyces lycii]|uniref:CD225/dispanin family protein n=1 Tax=Streptomyces lycii TaxID=2654337 RepID=A0ABQ7FKL0_9ACTN|nr:hypothetical protein [Streptomyces lycii]KAF4408920.1 hypothetical protein GCU69_11585 [Streptomyces lycii]